MTTRLTYAIPIGALVMAFALAILPVETSAMDPKWIDDITAILKDHQELAKFDGRDAAYYPYLAQLAMVKSTFTVGNREGTSTLVNELMDMLEHDAKAGRGIPIWSAKAIFDFCGAVTPAGYHDAARHNPSLAAGGFDYWADEVFDPGAGG